MAAFPARFTFALCRRAATYFLCVAKESKQRKATPVAGRAWGAASLTPHGFSGACELARLGGLKQGARLNPENRALFGCARGRILVVANIAETEGSLKAEILFSGCLVLQYAPFSQTFD